MKARLTLVTLAAWLVIGVGVKHVRYGDASVLGIVTAEANLADFAQRQGWQVAERIALGTDNRYATLILKKAECPAPLAVMLLDSSDSGKEIFERAVKGDLTYIEAGVPHATPPMAKLWLHNSLATLFAPFGGAAAFPIVAVAPSSAAGEGVCSLGVIGRWNELTAVRRTS